MGEEPIFQPCIKLKHRALKGVADFQVKPVKTCLRQQLGRNVIIEVTAERRKRDRQIVGCQQELVDCPAQLVEVLLLLHVKSPAMLVLSLSI